MQTRHFAQLVGLSALWGASFLFIRIASPVMGPLVLAGCRVALAGLTLACIMRGLRQAWPWAYWRELLLLGALSVVTFWGNPSGRPRRASAAMTRSGPDVDRQYSR